MNNTTPKLHPTRGPTPVSCSLIRFQIKSVNVKTPNENGVLELMDAILVERSGDATMIIDPHGTARFVRRQRSSQFPEYVPWIYVGKPFSISTPFERPFSELSAFYERCLTRLTARQLSEARGLKHPSFKDLTWPA